MQERRIQLTEGTLSYFDFGKGPVLVFLQGVLVTPHVYLPLLKLLSKHYRVIAPTLPGHGTSFSFPDHWELHDFIPTLEEFFKKLSITPSVLMGHSFGGILALLLAKHGWGEVVVGLAPPALSYTLTSSRYTKETLREIVRDIVKNRNLASLYLLYIRTRSVFSTISRHFFELAWFSKKVPVSDITKELTLIDIPVTLLWGEKDRVAPLSMGRAMRDTMRYCTLTVFPDQGHDFPIDEPEFSYQELYKALEKKESL